LRINIRPGEPFTHAPSTNTTTRFQLSISVLISFFLPAGAALSRLVLVVGDAAAGGRQRPVKTLDPTNACVFALLDRAPDGQRRLLGRLGNLRRTGRGHFLLVAAPCRRRALLDRRQNHQAKERQETAAGAQDENVRVRPLRLRAGDGLAPGAVGAAAVAGRL